MELFNVVTVEQARKIIDENFDIKAGSEYAGILETTGRVLCEDIISGVDVPGFMRSTVDGYAVSSRDVFGAGEAIPSILNVKGEVHMGKVPPSSIERGECLYVPTGGMLPEGADSVVMIENTDKLDDDTVLVNAPLAPGDNIIDIGEDIKNGEIVIRKGTRLRPYEVGVLSSIGHRRIPVYKKLRVGIISTGDEIVGSDEIPGPGRVRDINTYLLYSSVLNDGGEPVNYGLVRDEYDALKSTVEKAVLECDMVLISGGSSVGKKDQTLKVMDSFGKPGVLVHGISVKPGKPTIIGGAGDKAIFGLPGHPLACAIIYKIIVKYYMDRLMEYSSIEYPVICSFSINYHKAKGREEYLPVTLNMSDGEIKAEPVFGKSGLITGFSNAWGYVRIERNKEGLKAGETVYAYRL